MTTEQKIEELLEYLGHYISDSKDAFKGDSHIFNIVQAFVDSLKEGDNTKDFDENQLNAYRAFLEAGIPDEWANAMADRVNGVCDLGGKDAWECVMEFALWGATREGFRFWNDVASEVAKEGVSAFSKFQCPK